MTVEVAAIKVPFGQVRVQIGQQAVQEREITVNQPVNLVIIESSKPTYQPGERIQFRIFTLDSQLKPIAQKLSKVFVQNANELTVMEWQQVHSRDGVIELQMPIAFETVLGKWKIVAITEQQQQLTKTIEVNKEGKPAGRRCDLPLR